MLLSLKYILKYKFFSMNAYAPATHLIFDLDGTILDTETIYAEIYKSFLQEYGKEFTNEDRLTITGSNKFVGCKTIVEKYKLPLTPDEFYNKLQDERFTRLANPDLKPGAERLIRHLSSKNVPIAVATSSSAESFGIKTVQYKELFALFHHITNGSSNPEVPNGKPAPDIFLVCASKFPKKPQPNECLVFEDSANGVKGARAAGMQVVMIPEDYCPKELTTEATLVLRSMEQFSPEQFRLPPFSSK